MTADSQNRTPEEELRVKFFKSRLELAKKGQQEHVTYWKKMEAVHLGTQNMPAGPSDLLTSALKIKWAWQRWAAISPEIMDPEPRMEFKPVEVTDQRVSDILKVLTKQQLTQDGFVSKQPAMIDDAGIYGLSVVKVIWHQRIESLQTRRAQTLQERAIGAPIQYEERRVIVENRPTIAYVDPYDFFWDPAATSDENWRFVFHRVWLTREELKEREAKGIYRDVSLACDKGGETGPRSQTEKTTEADARRQNRFEVFEGYFDDGTRMAMCGDTLLTDGPHPYHHKRFPFVCWSTQPNKRSLVGRSEMESIEDLQLAIWLKDNQRIDAVNFAMFGFMLVDPTIPGVNDLKVHPGKVIKAMNGQRFEHFVMDPAAGAAFQESESYLAAMDAMTGYNSAIGGADAASLDRVTATVGTIAEEATDIRKAMKKLQFRLAISRIAKMWVQLDHQFLSEYELQRILGDEAIDYRPIPPEEIPMFLDVIPEAMSEAIGVMQKRSSLLELLNILGTLHGTQMLDGTYFDIKSLIEATLKSYDREPKQSFSSTPPPMQAPVSVPPVTPQAPPTTQDMLGDMGMVMAA